MGKSLELLDRQIEAREKENAELREQFRSLLVHSCGTVDGERLDAGGSSVYAESILFACRLKLAALDYASTAQGAVRATLMTAPRQCAACGEIVTLADMVPQDDDEDVCKACDDKMNQDAADVVAEQWRDYNNDIGASLARNGR